MSKMILRYVQLTAAMIVLLFGCSLTTAAFIVDPTGEIHTSVLSLFVTCLIYSAAFLGIKLPFTSKIVNDKTQATIQTCEESQKS